MAIARRRRVRRPFNVTVVGCLSVVVMAALALPATAEPADPTTSQQAEELWEAKEHEAAIAAEELSEAEMVAVATEADLQTAQDSLVLATQVAAQSQQAANEAGAAAETAQLHASQYQLQVDGLVNASFNGADTSSLTAFTTSQSPEDFLDRVAVLEQVAASSKLTLDGAVAAKDASAVASANAVAADAAAQQAEQAAVDVEAHAQQMAAAAAAAKEAALAKKTDLDLKVAEFQQLYYQLSEEERAAAAAEASAAEQESAQLQTERSAALDQVAANATATGIPAPLAGAASEGSTAGQRAVEAALTRLGMAYVWGATGPTSFDCSGLTMWAWNQAGVSIPRTSRAQAGLPVIPLDQLQPGDLITYYSPVSHVAMYIGNGQIVHASNDRQPVLITTVDRGGPNPTAHRVG